MKTKVKVNYLGNLEGKTKQGKEWHAIKVQDENLQQFLIFGDKATDYLGATLGDKIELEIEINSKMNYQTNRNEISLTI